MSDERGPEPEVVLRVVRGNPTPEELAALVAVVAARSGGGAPRPPMPAKRWADPRRLVRGHPAPAPGGWRASALPL